MNEWIERGNKVIMNTYNQFPIVLERGNGVYLWDSEGKEYLDFVAGIAVNALGYNDSDYVKEITSQLTKLQHCSNLYWMIPSIELSELLVQNSCFDRIFYCNSGAEAVEAAIKLSKKYGRKTHGEHCYEIITMNKSFHGRTMATVTATGQTKSLNVNIPRGIKDDQKLRLRGKGMPGENGGAPGDLYIAIHIKNHPRFERRDDDIYVEKEVPFTTAALGGKIQVPGVEKTLNVSVPPGTNDSSLLRLKNQGFFKINSDQRGNLLIKIKITVPNKLNRNQKNLLEKLQNVGL